MICPLVLLWKIYRFLGGEKEKEKKEKEKKEKEKKEKEKKEKEKKEKVGLRFVVASLIHFLHE